MKKEKLFIATINGELVGVMTMADEQPKRRGRKPKAPKE